MERLFASLSIFGPLSLASAMIVVARLSRRLGAVTGRPPLYRWMYVGATFVCLGVVFRLASVDEAGRLHDQAALVYDAPFLAGLIIALLVTWRYWGWLLYERDS